MTTFADSSAVVKLYADEAGHELVRSLDAIVVSTLARVEVPAALWRKRRLETLPAAAVAALVRAFEADFFAVEKQQRFAIVAPGMAVLDRAADLSAAHRLRAYDAVQLASACAVRDADPDCHRFACFDGDLREAAAVLGFSVLP